ncbi:MAG: hypothetical protein ABI838_09470 [Chloroflexota bacterium]
MKAKHMLAATGVALVGTLAAASPGLAYQSFCESDPPVQVVTPAGHNVTINNWMLIETSNRHLLKQVVVYGTTEPYGPGHTLVTIHIHTPHGGQGKVHVTSRSTRFQQNANADGGWGEEIQLQMVLDSD